jgi:hypothetical protein
MSLDKNLMNIKFDTRLQEWSLKNGVLKEEELKKQLQALEDVSNNAVLIKVDDERNH